MIVRYIVKRTQFVCPEDWYMGGCPLDGHFIRCRIGELSQEQLAAWLKKDPANAGKYVKVEEVPEKEETPPTKGRKPKKAKVNEPSTAESDTAETKETEAQKDASTTSE